MPKSTGTTCWRPCSPAASWRRWTPTVTVLGTVVALTQAVRGQTLTRATQPPRCCVYLAGPVSGVGLRSMAITASHLRGGVAELPTARTVVGDRAHLHCTSVGRAACLRTCWKMSLKAICRTCGLAGCCNLSPDAARIGGNASVGLRHNQEHEPHTFCIGVPIFDGGGPVPSLRAACPAPIRRPGQPAAGAIAASA